MGAPSAGRNQPVSPDGSAAGRISRSVCRSSFAAAATEDPTPSLRGSRGIAASGRVAAGLLLVAGPLLAGCCNSSAPFGGCVVADMPVLFL